MADYVQRSSGLPSVRGAIDLCRGTPHHEIFEGGALGNCEFIEARLAGVRQFHDPIRLVWSCMSAGSRSSGKTSVRVFVVERGRDDDLDVLFCSVGHGVHGLSRYKVANCAVRYYE